MLRSRVVDWARRGWIIVGLCLATFLVLEVGFRSARAIRSLGGVAVTPPALPPSHPLAAEPWFAGWYQRPAIRSAITFDPYVTNRKSPVQAPGVTVDAAGRRATLPPTGGAGAGRRLFLLGGSTMWGYTARDSFTIPSLVAAELRRRGLGGVEVVNLAQPGYNATQDVITLLLALRGGEVPSAAVFLTTHKDIYAAFQAGRAGGITSEDVFARLLDPDATAPREGLGTLLRRSALLARLAPAAEPVAAPTRPPDERLCIDVAAQYYELARIADGLGRSYGFPVFFLRQPMLAGSGKTLTEWERSMPQPRHKGVYVRCMAAIDSTMHGVTRPSYESLAGIFDAESASVFLNEYGYLTERAGGAVAEHIVRLVEPVLRRAPTPR